MANSKIIITFTEDLSIGAQLGIEIGYDINPPSPFLNIPSTYIFNWVNLRGNLNEVTIGTPIIIPGERSAINFLEAFNLDVSGFIVTRLSNVVTIEYQTNTMLGYTYQAIFNSPVSIIDIINGGLILIPNDPTIDISIFNGSQDIFTIENLIFEQAVVPCTSVKLKATTNVLATKILTPILVNPNTNNPFNFEVLRGSIFELKLENSNGTQVIQLVEAPSILSALNFNVIVNNGPTTATVIIENSNTIGLTFEYSLDSSTWQTSNVFSGLIFGNYTIYIRDNLGCSISKTFIVDEFGIKIPSFYLSKANSFRFANRITWGDSENYKNDENTLSCEVDVLMVYKDVQRFNSADIITTQFESNYTTNIAKVIKSDLTEVLIPITKITSNIGIKDKRDARKVNLGNGKTGVYFVSGNIYDYTIGVVLNNYVLNGLLPEWGVIGNYFEISGLWYLIENIIYDEIKNSDVLVISNTYVGAEINVIAGSIYNRENYEVYEFSIDMVDYIEERFRVQLECLDPKFTTIKHLSEEIYCKIKHEQTLELEYSNSTNTDIMYSTGIKHKLRPMYSYIKGRVDESSENHKTDTNAILLDAELYEGDEFIFEPVTKEIWKKLKIALSHENLTINGVGYVNNGDFNTDGPLEKSNLYVLTASMIKTGSVYNSQTSGSSGFNTSDVEIPGLIQTEIGYLKY